MDMTDKTVKTADELALEQQLADDQLVDIVRVLRVIEYTGPRDVVEMQVARSLHGTRYGCTIRGRTCLITAATVGDFPLVLERARAVDANDKEIKI